VARETLRQPVPDTASTSLAGRRQPSRYVRLAAAHYAAGLGYLGLGQTDKARVELKQALENSPDLLGARAELASLQ
jgi:Tfp pilus assembly protein PilF